MSRQAIPPWAPRSHGGSTRAYPSPGREEIKEAGCLGTASDRTPLRARRTAGEWRLAARRTELVEVGTCSAEVRFAKPERESSIADRPSECRALSIAATSPAKQAVASEAAAQIPPKFGCGAMFCRAIRDALILIVRFLLCGCEVRADSIAVWPLRATTCAVTAMTGDVCAVSAIIARAGSSKSPEIAHRATRRFGRGNRPVTSVARGVNLWDVMASRNGRSQQRPQRRVSYSP